MGYRLRVVCAEATCCRGEITLMALFPVLASGIIVFVPLYKKYVKHGGSK